MRTIVIPGNPEDMLLTGLSDRAREVYPAPNHALGFNVAVGVFLPPQWGAQGCLDGLYAECVPTSIGTLSLIIAQALHGVLWTHPRQLVGFEIRKGFDRSPRLVIEFEETAVWKTAEAARLLHRGDDGSASLLV